MPGRLWRFSWRVIASLIIGSLSKETPRGDRTPSLAALIYLEWPFLIDRYHFHCSEFLLPSETRERNVRGGRIVSLLTCFFCHSNSFNARSDSCRRLRRAYSLALPCDSKSAEDWPIVWKMLSRRRTDSYTKRRVVPVFVSHSIDSLSFSARSLLYLEKANHSSGVICPLIGRHGSGL